VLDLPEGPLTEGVSVTEESEAPAELVGEIMVVEDDQTVVDMLRDVLEALGHEAVLVGDADAALEQFTAGRFGLALIDQNLPGRSGLELAKDLRKRDPDMTLVLVTGWGNEDIVARAREHGCDMAEEKPLSVGKIRQILARAGARKAPNTGDEDRR
jgi:CheY-like chemotaxis protein